MLFFVVITFVGLTKKFYNTMLKFCFPERDPDMIDDSDRGDDQTETETKSKKVKGGKKNRDSNFYVNIERPPIDDVEKMKAGVVDCFFFVYCQPLRLFCFVCFSAGTSREK